MMGFLVGLMAGFWGLFLAVAWFATPDHLWQSQAIERGYALYCPNNGNFAWIGECE
jgi:hypothetical protein